MAPHASATPKKKRGRPPKANLADLSPSGLRSRKHRAKYSFLDLLRAPTADFFRDALPPLPETPPAKKKGRPLLPFEKLSKRGARARRSRARSNLATALLACAAVDIETTPIEDERQDAEEPELARVEAERDDADLVRRERQAARLLHQLSERNPEGGRGLVHRSQEMTLAVKSGECCACFGETDTFSPCCGVAVIPGSTPSWFCSVCVGDMGAAYARAPATPNGYGPPIDSNAVGRACPCCRTPGVFGCGARALWRAV